MVKLKFSTVVLIIVALSDVSLNTNKLLAETEIKSAQNTLTRSKEEEVNKVSEKIVEYPSSQYQILNKSNLFQHQLYIAQVEPVPHIIPKHRFVPEFVPHTPIKKRRINTRKIQNQMVIKKTTTGITILTGTIGIAGVGAGAVEVTCYVTSGHECITCKDSDDCEKKAQ